VARQACRERLDQQGESESLVAEVLAAEREQCPALAEEDGRVVGRKAARVQRATPPQVSAEPESPSVSRSTTLTMRPAVASSR
jgi:hypothetical protein